MTDIQRPTHEGLLCPTCRIDLVMSDRQGIEIDYCPKCRGVWLDRGELDKIIERSTRESTPSPLPAPGSPEAGAPGFLPQPGNALPWGAAPMPLPPAPAGYPAYQGQASQGGHGEYEDHGGRRGGSHGGGHGGGHGGSHGGRRGFLGRIFD